MFTYIPRSQNKKRKWGSDTNTKHEFEMRNMRIYDNHLEGHNVSDIASRYFLSEKSIRIIILQVKKSMATRTQMIKDHLYKWGLEGGVDQLYHSTWSINGDYVLKVYDDENSLKRNITIFKQLQDQGIPVPQVITLKDKSDYLIIEDKQYVITTQLKGRRNLDINTCDDQWLHGFGEIIGDLHQAFLSVQDNISYWNNSMLEEMNGWVIEQLNYFKLDGLDLNKVTETIQELKTVYNQLPKQLIHRDINLGNFLFAEESFSGYVDFDLSQSNIRLFDVCYFLIGLLCEGHFTKAANDKWFTILEEVMKGYHSKMTLTNVELESVPCVMKNIELLFVAYFLMNKNTELADDAIKLFNFIDEHSRKINDILAALQI